MSLDACREGHVCTKSHFLSSTHSSAHLQHGLHADTTVPQAPPRAPVLCRAQRAELGQRCAPAGMLPCLLPAVHVRNSRPQRTTLCTSRSQGLANAASAGMLLYIALVQLVAEHNKYVAAYYTTSSAAAAATTASAAAAGPPSSAVPHCPSSSQGPSPPTARTRHQRLCSMPSTILLVHAALVAGAAMM